MKINHKCNNYKIIMINSSNNINYLNNLSSINKLLIFIKQIKTLLTHK